MRLVRFPLVLALLWLAAVTLAWGQRPRFNSPFEQSTVTGGRQIEEPPYTSGPRSVNSTYDPFADDGSGSLFGLNNWGRGRTPARPVYQSNPLYPDTGPPALDPYTPTPSPSFDPYAGPSYAAPPGYPVLPDSAATPGFGSGLAQGTDPYAAPGNFWVERPRGLRELHFIYTYVPDLEGGGLGLQNFDFQAEWAVNPFYTADPLILRPGFTINLWEGPDTVPLPGQTYDAYLGIGWRPRLAEFLLLDLEFRPSISSDFDTDSSDMFRFQGRAVIILAFSQQVQVALGAAYLDLMDIKVLPIGGVIWHPNPDMDFELIFPKPRIRQRLGVMGAADFYGYVGAEFYGGTWAITRDDGVRDRFDYNDIRILAGLEWEIQKRRRAFVEFGYVFERNLKGENFLDQQPDDSLFLRAGFAF